MPSCPGHVPHVFACGQKRPLVPRTSLSHPVCFQPPCAHRCAHEWLQDVLRDRERRSGRDLCIWAASMARLHGSVTVGIYGCVLAVPFGRRGGPLDGVLELDQSGVQRVVERRILPKRGLWRPHIYPGYTPCWTQVDCSPSAAMVSDAVTDLVRVVGRGRYFRYLTNYTAYQKIIVGF